MGNQQTLNTVTRAGGQFDEVIQERWNPRLLADIIYNSFLHQFEGGEFYGYDSRVFASHMRKGHAKASKKMNMISLNGGKHTAMPVVVKGDNFKDVKGGKNVDKSGDLIHMQVLKAFVPQYTTNDATLRGKEALLDYGQFDVGIDAYRTATAFTQTASELTLLDDREIAYSVLAGSAAQKMDSLGFSELLFNGGTNTGGTTFTTPTVYAGGQTSSIDVVSSQSVITVDDLKRFYFKLKGQGAMPISIDKAKVGNRMPSADVPRYICLISMTDEYNLILDSDYENYMLDAGVRGDANRLFTGQIANINAFGIYSVPDPDQGSIRVGNPLRPVTTIAEATGTGVGTWKVGAVTDDNYDYTLFFPEAGQLVILDSSGTVLEVVTYTAKTGQTFTVSARAVLGADTSHAVGTEVALVTNRVLGLGGQALLKSYGKAPYFIKQMDDYEEDLGFGIRFVCGNQAMLDSDDTPKNFAVMETFGFEDFR